MTTLTINKSSMTGESTGWQRWKRRIMSNLFIVPFVVTLMYAMNTRTTAILINRFEESVFLCGIMFFLLRFGYFLSNILAMFSLDHLGTRMLLIASMGVLLLSSAVMMFWNSYVPVFVFSILLAGITGGMSRIGSHSLVDELSKISKGKQFVRLHLVYVLGSLIPSALFGSVLFRKIGWNGICAINTCLVGIGLFITYINIANTRHDHILREDRIPANRNALAIISDIRAALVDRRVMFYSIALGLFTAFELGMFSWLIMFYLKEVKATMEVSSQLLSILFISLVIGRFIGGPLVEKIGYWRSILAMCTIVTALFLIVFLAGGFVHYAYYLLPFYGLFSAVLYPLTFTLACENIKEKTGAIISSMFLVSAVLPPLANVAIGKIASCYGMKLGMLFLFLLFLLYFAMMVIKYFRRNHDSN